MFFVDAAGSGPLSYQWHLNATNVVGISDYSLIITNAQAANIGAYSVVVSNSYGSVTSAPAVLTVLLPPAITNQTTEGQTNYVGGNAYFTVGASGSGSANLFYQWRLNGTNLAGATNFTLALNNIQPASAGNYSVVITNLYGKIISSNALLTLVNPACDTMPSGLVGWWQGEGSSADVISGNLGTLVGAVTYVPGKVGRAFAQVQRKCRPGGFRWAIQQTLQLQNLTIDAWIKRSSTNQA